MNTVLHPNPPTRPDEDGTDSQTLITMRPALNDEAFIAKQGKAFSLAFHQTMRGEVEGAMSTYLFYDLSADSDSAFGGLSYDASSILSGGRAWERRINENAAKPPSEGHSFIGDDKQVISFALKNGLMALLPDKIQYVSYGGGDEQAFTANEGQLIKAAQLDPTKQILNFCSVDILPRYVDTMTYAASRRYKLDSQGVQGDFLRNGRLAINKVDGATPVVMIFGGPFENVSVDTQKPDTAEQAETNVAIAWGKMNIQHGLGSIVVKTFDSDQDKTSQEAKYAPTRNFEAFELSFLARAVENGIINNPDYDVFEHWRLTSEYDVAARANKLHAECKKDHILQTVEGDQPFKAGDRRTITLSHKWDQAVHIRAAERAGYEVLEVFTQPGNKNLLMVAKAVRDPDADILKSIPYPR